MSEHLGGAAPSPSRRDVTMTRVVRAVARGTATWGALLLVGWTLWVARQPLDPDYTSGELLDHLMAWAEGAELYPPLAPLPPLRVLNYPPLVLVVARGFMALGSAPLAAGRMATALGVILLLAAVVRWARARGASTTGIAGTLGVLAGSFPLLYASGQFHVEPWAAAGTLWGATLLDRPSRRTGLLAGLALAAACFAKQTAVIPALIVLIWAFRYRRDLAPAALGGWLLGGLVGASLMTAVWGVEPWRHLVLYTVGTADLANMGSQLLRYALPWAILLGAGSVALVHHRDRSAPDLLPVLVIGTALWSLSAIRDGASFGYFLDLHLLTALWIAPGLFSSTGPRWPDGRPLHRAATALLLLQVVGAAIGTTTALGINVARRTDEPAALAALCRRVDPAELLTEEAGVARGCGAPAPLHPFIMTSLARQGRWDPALFEQALRSGRWPAVVLAFDPRAPISDPHDDRWTLGMLDAFRTARHIEPVGTGRWLLTW